MQLSSLQTRSGRCSDAIQSPLEMLRGGFREVTWGFLDKSFSVFLKHGDLAERRQQQFYFIYRLGSRAKNEGVRGAAFQWP